MRRRRLVSAQRLDDVPVVVRTGSPSDLPDGLVYRMAKRGLLPPGTNYGVVYRVAFAPVLAPEEHPAEDVPSALPVDGFATSLVFRFGWAIPPDRISEAGNVFSVTQREIDHGLFGAWMLLTTRGIRWHFTGDGVPQLHPGIDANLGDGVRFLDYADLKGPSQHHQMRLSSSQGASVEMDFFVFETPRGSYAFGLSGAYAPENVRWYDYVRQQG